MMGMPSCCDVSRAVASGALEDAPARRRLAVRLHLLMCRHCRRYARQLRAIALVARDLFRRPSGEDESLERLRQALLGRLEPPDES
jgi:hypothetical protein